MGFCTPRVTEQPSTPAGVIFATLPQSPHNGSWAFSLLPAAKSQTKESERTSFIKASLEHVMMGVSVYKTFISGGKQSLKAYTFALNMDKFIGKHYLTITFSHHRSRQAFIPHSSVVSIDSCSVASASFPGEKGGVGVNWVDGKEAVENESLSLWSVLLPFSHTIFLIDFSILLPIIPYSTPPLSCYHKEKRGGTEYKIMLLCMTSTYLSLFSHTHPLGLRKTYSYHKYLHTRFKESADVFFSIGYCSS